MCVQRKEDHVRFSGISVKDSYELACGGWESNLCPLEEQLVFLTVKHHLAYCFDFLACRILICTAL